MRRRLRLFVLSNAMPDWYVYIERCDDGSLYTGIATDVERRLADHVANKGSKYLRGRGPLKVVFKKKVGQKGQALKAEQQIKRLPRYKKEALVKTGEGIETLLTNN